MKTVSIFAWAVAAFAQPDVAQIRDLATTGDGQVLYFATSLPFRGSTEPSTGRIYRIAAGGLERVYSRTQWQEPCQTGVPCFTNYYELSLPDVSGGGEVVSFTGRRGCGGSARCSLFGSLQSTLSAGRLTELDGSVRLSRNGRYAVATRMGNFEDQAQFVDLAAGTRTRIARPLSVSHAGRSIADDGTLVEGSIGSLGVWRNGIRRHLVGSGSIEEPAVDATARHVVYTTRGGGARYRSIRAYDLAFDTDRAFLSGNGDVYSPSISADGRRVTFLSTAQFGTANPPQPPQLFAVNLDGTGYRQITFEKGGVLHTVTSDDGRVSWYVSGEGRLVKAYLDTGQLVETLAAPASLLRAESLVPGSVAVFSGVGLSGTATVDGREARVIESSPTAMTVLVPWETPAGESSSVNPPRVDVRIIPAAPKPSPFEAKLQFAISSFVRDPSFIADELNGPAKAAHGDWSGLVTEERPAWPGEIVHLYAKRLGPVDSEGRVTPTLRCTVASADNTRLIDVPVLYAGLAPGFEGYYQISIRIPSASLLPLSYFRFVPEGSRFDFGARLPVSRWPIP